MQTSIESNLALKTFLRKGLKDETALHWNNWIENVVPKTITLQWTQYNIFQILSKVTQTLRPQELYLMSLLFVSSSDLPQIPPPVPLWLLLPPSALFQKPHILSQPTLHSCNSSLHTFSWLAKLAFPQNLSRSVLNSGGGEAENIRQRIWKSLNTDVFILSH